jgi:TonB family protein
VRTRSELSDETVRQADASLIFVKLRKMIASDTQPTDTILGTIAVAAHSLTGATGAAIAMPRDGAVVCVGRSGETAPELGDRLSVDSGISGECMRTGVSMRCDDASRDFHVDAEVCRQMGLQSIAVVPLRGQHGRVGVLEAFSTQAYAFSEDKMEVLGRLAGLAEAAWARGAVTEVPAGEGEEVPAGDEVPAAPEIAALVEAPAEPAHPGPAAVALAQVREVFATVLHDKADARRKWRYAAIAVVAVLGLVLISVYGWRAWYKASVGSATSQPAAGAPVPAKNQNAAAAAGLTSTPDIVRPASRPRELPTAHATKPVIPDKVTRRRPRSAPPADDSAANTGDPSSSGSNPEDAPLIAAASSTGPADLGKVLSTAPALPHLGAPISQGVAGGVLVHKVQPVYPAEARRMRVQGSVVIEAIVTVQGQVDDLKLISGDARLAPAAMEAVGKWRYSPYTLNGRPIPKETRITITFIAPQ